MPIPMSPNDLIQSLGSLPPLPDVAARALRISQDSDSSSDQLLAVIRTDQVLSAQVLRIANSAMFGLYREVTTLSQAVLTLGFSTTRAVVLAACVKDLFHRGPALPQARVLWEHALTAALAGNALGKAMAFAEPEEVFLGALLHDLGKTLLLLKFPDRYGALLERVQHREGEGLSLELEAFGFDHTLVGEALLRSWDLAEGFQAAARWHHDPFQAPKSHHRLVAFVALGNQAAADLRIGTEDPEALAGATWEALDILGLDEPTFQAHRTEAMQAVEQDKGLLAEL